MRLFLLWIASAASVVLLAEVLPWVSVTSFGLALVVALILGLVNITLKPILLLLTLPLNVLTLGLFTFVVNALMVLLVDAVIEGFDAGNFWTALIIALVMAFLSSVILDTKEPRRARA